MPTASAPGALALDGRFQREAVHHRASMPMVSPVGRDTPREETSTPRTMLPPPITTATSMPSWRAAIRSSAMRSMVGLVDTERVRAGQIFAGQLDHDATIDRLSHDAIAFLSRAGRRPADRTPDVSGYFLPLAAATSAAKSLPASRFPRREHSSQSRRF